MTGSTEGVGLKLENNEKIMNNEMTVSCPYFTQDFTSFTRRMPLKSWLPLLVQCQFFNPTNCDLGPYFSGGFATFNILTFLMDNRKPSFLLVLYLSRPTSPFKSRKNGNSAQRGWRQLANRYHSRNHKTYKEKSETKKWSSLCGGVNRKVTSKYKMPCSS